MSGLPPHEAVPGFGELGLVAFTTTRQAGSFHLGSAEPVADVVGRWTGVLSAAGAVRLACSVQVHGTRVLAHGPEWEGWLRVTTGADGHMARHAGTALAVTLADCVPVFFAHPSGVFGVLHSGWKGTAAGITRTAIERLVALGCDARSVRIHLGPAICGQCYEVGPDVHFAVTGNRVDRPAPVDLRRVIAAQARAAGVGDVTISSACTRCDNGRFFSHRAGDAGRHIALISRQGVPLSDGGLSR